MNNESKKAKLGLAIEYGNEDSYNSIDENDFQTVRFISLRENGISVEKLKSNNKITKNNTKMSSNVEDTDNENENKSEYLNIQITESNKHTNNNDNNDNNVFNCSDNNLIIHHRKNKLIISSNLNMNENNDNDKVNNSVNHNIMKKNDIYNDCDNGSINKKSSFSPIKKRRKLVLEEKQKSKGRRRSIYATEHKEEAKNEDKKIRKDKNGTEICKKNKKKVKISFDPHFVNVIPIESFKKYNVIVGLPKGEKYYNGRDDCQCCSII